MPLVVGLMLAGVAAWLLKDKAGALPISLLVVLVSVLLFVWLLWYTVGFLRANSAMGHGDLSAVTSDDPPASEPAGAGGAGFGPGQSPGVRRFYASTLVLMAAASLTSLFFLWAALGTWRFPAAVFEAIGIPSAAESERQFVLYSMPQLTFRPGWLEWNFKCLIPVDHLAHILFVHWTNGVPVVKSEGSAYYEVGKNAVDRELKLTAYYPGASLADATNSVHWWVELLPNTTSVLDFPKVPAYRRLETPARLIVRSGHQAVLRLVDDATPEGQSGHGKSGVELRILLEPMKFAPTRIDPFQNAGPNNSYVAGPGPGWAEDVALKTIKQWPVDQ